MDKSLINLKLNIYLVLDNPSEECLKYLEYLLFNTHQIKDLECQGGSKLCGEMVKSMNL